MENIENTIDGLEEENVGTMLPQIGLDGTAKEDKVVDDGEEKEAGKLVPTTEDADDETINLSLKTDIPRNIRKNISKIATLEAKIKDAKNLNYEAATVQKLKAELLTAKTTLNKDLKSMSKEEKSDVKKLIEHARKSVTIEDRRNEKNVNESGEYDDTSREIIFGGENITESVSSDEVFGLVCIVTVITSYVALLVASVVSAIKEARKKFRKINANELPKGYDLPDKDKAYIDSIGEKMSKVVKTELGRVGGNNVEKRDGKVVSTVKDYTKLDNKITKTYWKNKKGEYLYLYTKILLSYEAPFAGYSNESGKIENAVRQIYQEVGSELHDIEDSKMCVYFFHNDNNSAKTEGQIIIYEERILKKDSGTKVSTVKEMALEALQNDADPYYFTYEEAKERFEKTGETRYELQMQGCKNILDKIYTEIAKVSEDIITEKASMEDEIKPIVDTFNRKGYKVKYASPGHSQLRKKEDQEPDGVFKGKLYSDARVAFEDKYDFPKAPKYWYWKDVDDISYLDVEDYPYDEKDGTPDEAFKKWKTNYMESLKKFANELKENGSKEEETTESVDATSLMDDIFDSIR